MNFPLIEVAKSLDALLKKDNVEVSAVYRFPNPWIDNNLFNLRIPEDEGYEYMREHNLVGKKAAQLFYFNLKKEDKKIKKIIFYQLPLEPLAQEAVEILAVGNIILKVSYITDIFTENSFHLQLYADIEYDND